MHTVVQIWPKQPRRVARCWAASSCYAFTIASFTFSS